MEKFKPNLLKCICFFCFVLIFCSCSPSHAGGKTAATASTTAHPLPTTSSATNAAGAQTDCPPANTARAAFMPSITLGTHPNIFYSTVVMNNQSESVDSAFHRYDVTTGQTTQVIALPPSHQGVGGGSLSNDGQWIIFGGAVDTMGGPVGAIQMVRVDGQEFQTLYCGTVDGILLSPDQRTLAFASSGNLEMLDMTSGRLQTDITVSQAPSGNAIYSSPVRWQTNTSLFVVRGPTGPDSSFNPETDLLKDTTLDSNSQATNLQQVFSGVDAISIGGLDINQNQILVSSFTVDHTNYTDHTETAWTGPSKITVRTLDGNVSTIYTDPTNAIVSARFVSRTKIAFFTENMTATMHSGEASGTTQNVGIWTINTDGTDLAQIATFPDNSEFNPPSSFMVSRDGNQYFILVGPRSIPGDLFVGKLQGGTEASPVIRNSASGNLNPIGWSTF